MIALDQTFEALADPARLAMIRLLAKKPMRSSDVADALSLSRPITSRHLRLMRQIGIVVDLPAENDARVRVYQLRPDRFSELREWLDEVEAFWADQLRAFKAHAEGKHGKRR